MCMLTEASTTKMFTLCSLCPRAELITPHLGLSGPLSLSSVLGHCSPEPAEEATTTKQIGSGFRVVGKDNFKVTPQNTTLGALTEKLYSIYFLTCLDLLSGLKSAIPNLKI